MYLELANKIGGRISKDAIWYDDRCCWLEGAGTLKGGYAFKNSGTNLYSGTSGIALFLAALFNETGEELFRKTAEGAMDYTLLKYNKIPEISKRGYYTGIPGIIDTLIKTSAWLKKEEYKAKADSLLKEYSKLDFEKKEIDVISGPAGVLPAMIEWKKKGLNVSDELLLRHYLFLLENSKEEKIGSSWNTMDECIQNLTGFAHGASGIAYALLKYYEYTGNKEAKELAVKAMEYEWTCFDEEENNWYDFRNFANQNYRKNGGKISCMNAWCHGAPGIAITRYFAYRLFENEETKRELNKALQTTFDNIKGSLSSQNTNFSLCHGLSGNLELLLRLSPANIAVLNDLKTNYIQSLQEQMKHQVNITSGLADNLQNNSLLLGDAGVGYFLLILTNKDKYPSILYS